jgi:antitoxin component of RelBE/YafQ-DinJ toxin-antitoxin module
MQIRVTEDLRERAKAVAKQKGLTLSELIIRLLASAGDKRLKDLADKESKERPKPGRPWDK